LGVVLFELIAERSPFELANKSATEVEHDIVHLPAPSMRHTKKSSDKNDLNIGAQLRKLSNDRVSELDSVVQKALRKEPEQRHQSADEFAQDLEHWLQGLPVQAKGSHAAYRFKKFVQRHKALVAASVVITALLLGSAILFAWQNNRVRAERDRAALSLDILTDAFTAADPLQSSKGAMTVRDLLQTSAKKIEALSGAQPKDFIVLAERIADVQSKLGLFKDAQVLSEKAYERANETGDSSAAAALLRLDARARVAMGQDDLARTLLEKESSPKLREHPEYPT
jgi:eukaryotic-like serine/threonine-protein kinase